MQPMGRYYNALAEIFCSPHPMDNYFSGQPKCSTWAAHVQSTLISYGLDRACERREPTVGQNCVKLPANLNL